MRNRLRNKILVTTTLLITIIVGGILFFVGNAISREIANNHLEKLSSTATSFAQVHRDSILSYDYTRIKHILQHIQANDELVSIAFTFFGGEQVSVKRDQQPITFIQSTNHNTLALPSNQVAKNVHASIEQQPLSILSLQHTIYINNEKWAELILLSDTANYKSVINKTQTYILTIGFLGLLIGITLSYIFARRLAQPIESLTQLAATMLSSEEDNHPRTQQHDEISKLTITFNHMRDRILSQVNQLKSSNEELTNKNRSLEIEITNNRQQTLALQRNQHRLGQAQEVANLGLWEYKPADQAFYCSDIGCDLLRLHKSINDTYDLTAFVGRMTARCQRSFKEALSRVTQNIIAKETITCNIPARDTEGSTKNQNRETYICITMQNTAAQDNNNESLIIGTIADVTDEFNHQTRIQELAYQDSVSHLSNRRFFDTMLKIATENRLQKPFHMALAFLDIDKFKVYNDTYSHSVGDEILRAVAQRLQDVISTDEFVIIPPQYNLKESKRLRFDSKNYSLLSRFGGDEFVILLTSSSTALIKATLEQLEVVLEGFTIHVPNGPSCHITLSYGSVETDENFCADDDLLTKAALALHTAKRANGKTHYRYDKTMKADAQNRLILERNILQAIKNHEFELFFQPRVALKNNSINGVEALLRWSYANEENIAINEVIAVAEEMGVIHKITNLVIDMACEQALEWRQQHQINIPISINVSPLDILEHNLHQQLKDGLQRFSLPAQALQIEIVETSLLHDLKTAIDQLQKIRALQIKILIDDFGSGYSSLAYLSKLPIDGIKIDRSLIELLNTQSRRANITETAINIGRSLGLDVTAEGVENDRQLDMLRNLKCDEYQGYLFSKPLPAQQITQQIKLANKTLEIATSVPGDVHA